MKQRRSIPWKPLLFSVALCFLILQFFREYFWPAAFFGFWLLLTASMMGITALRERRKARQAEETQEAAVSRQREERRKLCRESRYSPIERESAEAYIVEALGPIARWDRQEGGGTPDIDVAFVPPAEAVPYWRAATVGAGAVSAEGGRTELVLLLPPDQDPVGGWASRVLREAAQTLLVYEGGIRAGAAFRGFHLLGAGFAGAAAADPAQGLPGFPALAPLLLPTGETLWFTWLLPLLKPEWDYFQERGLASLFRRMAGRPPAADPARTPWADWDWFQEETAPFAWSETEGRFCLGLNTGEFQKKLFLRAGLAGTGWDWERLAREYLERYQRGDGPFVEYACEDWVFFAASADEEILRRLALGLSDLLRYRPEEALALLAPDERAWKGAF